MIRSTVSRSLLGAAAIAFLASAGPVSAQTTLTFFTGNDQADVAYSQALAKAFEKQNPGVKIEIDVGPGGTERDNMVKSRLATGTMDDVFEYNAGSLFQAINPTHSVVDLSNEPWQANIQESFKKVVTAPDGTVRGGPYGMAMGGGIFYNIPIYKKLGLKVPVTWKQFMDNNAKIKAAGKVPVIQTFGDTWTSQIFFLADYYNVQAQVPGFAAKYTANKAKIATTPAALRGFQYQEEVYKAGDLNKDFGAAKLADGLRMVATGEGAHYPMLTFALGPLGKSYPKLLNDVGFFAIPSDSPKINGLTIWMPTGLYISAQSKHIDLAKKFIAFAETPAACKIRESVAPVTGPFLVKGCSLPANVPTGVADMQPYFDQGHTAPALEFLSPIKGPNLENITVAVGSGITSAKAGAAQYDEDVKKQAMQLGLPGW